MVLVRNFNLKLAYDKKENLKVEHKDHVNFFHKFHGNHGFSETKIANFILIVPCIILPIFSAKSVQNLRVKSNKHTYLHTHI